jgi:hypothetical protein
MNKQQAHESQVHLHEAQAAFRSKRSRTDNLLCSRILQEAGKANKLSMRSFWTCAKRMIRSEGWLSKLLERCGWKVMAGPARPSC